MAVLPWVGLVLSLVSAALFLQVGRTIARRKVAAEARSAQKAFILWWNCLAAVTLVGSVLAVPGVAASLQLYLAFTGAALGLICVALAGLVHYLVFLYTNRNRLSLIAAGYFVLFVLLSYFIGRNHPDGLEPTHWGPRIHYATPIESGPLYWAVTLLLLVPPLVSALAYLSLYRKTEDPVLKRRILLVSASLAVWFGSSLIGSVPGAGQADWWILSSRLISLGAAGTILYAYAGLGPARPEEHVPPRGEESTVIYESPENRLAHVQPL